MSFASCSKNITENELCDHEKLIKLSENTLKSIFEQDSLLSDLHEDITYEEVLDKIGLITGTKILIEIERGIKNDRFKIVVDRDTSTLVDLKKAIKREYQLTKVRRKKQIELIKENTEKPSNSSSTKLVNDETTKSNVHLNTLPFLSWRFLWRRYILKFNGIRLTDENKLLKDYGITDNSLLKFVRKIH